MGYSQKLPFIVLSLVLMSGCAITTTKGEVKEEDRIPAPQRAEALCKYTHFRGIAELIAVTDTDYQFTFFPGNLDFSIRLEESQTKLENGGEYRALYEKLLEGGDHCEKPRPRLIDSPH